MLGVTVFKTFHFTFYHLRSVGNQLLSNEYTQTNSCNLGFTFHTLGTSLCGKLQHLRRRTRGNGSGCISLGLFSGSLHFACQYILIIAVIILKELQKESIELTEVLSFLSFLLISFFIVCCWPHLTSKVTAPWLHVVICALCLCHFWGWAHSLWWIVALESWIIRAPTFLLSVKVEYRFLTCWQLCGCMDWYNL